MARTIRGWGGTIPCLEVEKRGGGGRGFGRYQKKGRLFGSGGKGNRKEMYWRSGGRISGAGKGSKIFIVRAESEIGQSLGEGRGPG